LARLVFSRKNKTLGAQFKGKKTIALLRDNYRTYCSLKNREPDPEFNQDPDEFIKKRITEILEAEGFDEKRSGKMDNDDMLRLLARMNEKDIHFV